MSERGRNLRAIYKLPDEGHIKCLQGKKAKAFCIFGWGLLYHLYCQKQYGL